MIDELRIEDTAIARNIADHIDSFTDYDFAHLLFSDGSVSNAISLDNQLNIIQVADLVLPDKDTTFEEYTTIELLSVAMLIVISTFALDFIHSDRSIFKIVDLDEAWRSSTWHREKLSLTSWYELDVQCRLVCTSSRNPLGTCPKRA